MNLPASESACVPPKLPAARSGQPLTLALSVAAVVAVGALLFVFNPADHAFYPQCWFHQVTGLHCPGCGGLRAVHQLLHGNLLTALRLNGAAVVSLPLMGGFLGWEFVKRHRGITGRATLGSREVWCFLAGLVVFAVLRNLPAFAYLAP